MDDLPSTIQTIATFLGGSAAKLIKDKDKFERVRFLLSQAIVVLKKYTAKQIVRGSSLDSMKKDQKRWFPDEMTYRKDVFVRKGGSRDWKNFFSHEQSQRMDRVMTIWYFYLTAKGISYSVFVSVVQGR